MVAQASRSEAVAGLRKTVWRIQDVQAAHTRVRTVILASTALAVIVLDRREGQSQSVRSHVVCEIPELPVQ